MIIVLKTGATQADAEAILDRIEQAGLKPLFMPGVERIVLGAIGDERILQTLHFEHYPQVAEVKPILSPYKLVSREIHPHNTQVQIGSVTLGGPEFSFILGPELIESAQQLSQLQQQLSSHTNSLVHAAFHTQQHNQYDFQGLGQQGAALLAEHNGQLPLCTEITETSQLPELAKHADALLIGPNNMQNAALLKLAAETGKPIILSRNHSATLEAFLLAAEYLLSSGCEQVVLREQGQRSLDRIAPCSIDLAALAEIKQRCHLPVVVDLSLAAADVEMLTPLAKAVTALGVDGLMLNLHPQPEQAVCGAKSQLNPTQLQQLLHDITPFIQAAGRRV